MHLLLLFIHDGGKFNNTVAVVIEITEVFHKVVMVMCPLYSVE